MDGSARIFGMPMPRTAFIGRKHEIGIARGILSQPGTRLLTLTGVGGCGKTRLALRLLTDLAPQYPQRIWGVELAPVVDPDLIPIVVARTLNLQEANVTSTMDALAADLGARPGVLLLDNCEHLIDACASFVDALLDACPALRVIATSREPLHVTGERQYRVPPLDTPHADAFENIDRISASPAVQLFVTRAQAVLPSFQLTPDNAATIARICVWLDGIPLAVELAAARVASLGVEQILARLDDSFGLLTGSSRVAPTRHQTLHAALKWSDDLLNEAERAVFYRLAVFSGQFRFEATETICAGNDVPAEAMLDVVTSLVDQSLVVRGNDGLVAWYHLLEPIRQYALLQLAARGEAESLRSRHGAFYLELAEHAANGPQKMEQLTWMERMEREQDNIRSALHWAQQESPSVELRLAVALAPFCEMRGHLREGLGRLHGALACGAAVDPSLRARALAAAGRLAFYIDHSPTSRYTEAEILTRESLHLARDLDDEQTIAATLTDLGLIYRMQRDYVQSIDCLDDALTRFQDLDDEHGVAITLLHLGCAAYMSGDQDRGIQLLVDSLDRCRAVGDLRFAATAQVMLGRVAHDRREIKDAINLIVESMETHASLGDRWFVIFDMTALAGALVDAGRPKQGVRFMSAAQAQSDGLGSPVIGASFTDVLSKVDRLRQESWFDQTWAEGHALDLQQTLQAAREILDEPAIHDHRTGYGKSAAQPLTAREMQVAYLLAEGQTDRQIADALFVSVRTVGVHVHHILQKLELRSRVQVADWLASDDQTSMSPN